MNKLARIIAISTLVLCSQSAVGQTFGSSQQTGNTTFHQFNGNHGTSTQIGNTTYHRFNGNHGTSTRIGDTSYHRFNGNYGTSTRIGNTTYHRSNGNSGTSTRVGDTTYHSLSDFLGRRGWIILVVGGCCLLFGKSGDWSECL